MNRVFWINIDRNFYGKTIWVEMKYNMSNREKSLILYNHHDKPYISKYHDTLYRQG